MIHLLARKRLWRGPQFKVAIVTQGIAAIALLLSIGWFIIRTWHWPLSGDASVMHYIGFLLDTGRSPYRDIWDMDFPGAYLPNWFVQHFFGASAIAWRLYDFLILATIGFAMFVIARPRLGFAALWAASLFALVHGRDGMEQLGQRDLTAGALLVAGVACLLRATRLRRNWLAGLFGILAGGAATIKPSLACYVLLLAQDYALHRPRDKNARQKLYFGFVGWTLPFLLCAGWLYDKGSLEAFWFSVRWIIPLHASLGHVNLTALLYNSIAPFSLLLGAWVVVMGVQRFRTVQPTLSPEKRQERGMLLAAAAFGFVSYFSQQKGYPYHRYPFLIFALLVVGMDLTCALRDDRSSVKWLCSAAILWSSLILAPSSAIKAGNYKWRDQQFQKLLEADLHRVSPDGDLSLLSGHVLCLDSISGCLTELEKLHLVQTSPNLYDEFLFQSPVSATSLLIRDAFWRNLQEHPPRVMIVTDPLFPSGPNHYEKFARWPELDTWLRTHYDLVNDEQPTVAVKWMGRYVTPAGFRLYKAKKYVQ